MNIERITCSWLDVGVGGIPTIATCVETPPISTNVEILRASGISLTDAQWNTLVLIDQEE